jgi:hypothetical protein
LVKLFCGLPCSEKINGVLLFFLPHPHHVRFGVSVLLINPIAGTMYSVFRIHSAHQPYRRHNVFGFSYTFGSFTLSLAHCIRFFAYIRLINPIIGILYSVFRIHSAHLPYRWHNVFGFSYTFGSFTLSLAQCIRFFAYIRLIYSIVGTMYSVFRIHSAHQPYR